MEIVVSFILSKSLGLLEQYDTQVASEGIINAFSSSELIDLKSSKIE